MFKWINKNLIEQEKKRKEIKQIENVINLKSFLKRTCEVVKNNEIENAVYTVWTSNSSIIVTDDFLYFFGTTLRGNSTYFHYGEALSLNKIVSIESDFDIKHGMITLGFADGSKRYINTFNQTKRLDKFFKEKAKNVI